MRTIAWGRSPSSLRQSRPPQAAAPAVPANGVLDGRHIFAIFIAWTVFSVYVYSRYSQLGDAESYMTGAYDDEAQARTLLITALASKLFAVLRVDVLAHLAFSLFAASGVWYLARQAQVRGRWRWPLLAVLLLPNFGVWASVIGRESMFAALLAFFMGAVIGFYREGGFHRFLIALACVAGMVFIRAPFGLAMGFFFLMFLAYTLGPRVRLTLGVQAAVMIAVGTFLLMLAWPQIDAYITDEVLPKARSYFTISSATTRMWVDLRTTGEFFSSLWWTLPLALVGPTPAEVMARPVMLPFLLSGLMIVGLILYSLVLALRAPLDAPRKIMLLAWLPALVLILVAYVPFGVYNPGSGIRYASCFLMFLVFPPMFLSGLSAAASDEADEPEPIDIRVIGNPRP